MSLLLMVLGLIWGTNFVFMQWGVQVIDPLQIVWYRMLSATLPLFLYALLMKKLSPQHLRNWYHFLIMALLANVINFYYFARATSVISSGMAGAISGAIPIFTSLFSLVFLRDENVNKYKIFGVLVGFGGVLIISAPWKGEIFSENLLGIAYMVIGSVSYAFSFLYARRFIDTQRISSISLATYQIFFALVITSFLIDYLSLDNLFTSSKSGYGVILGLGVLGTGIAYIIYYRLIDTLGAIRASSVTYIPPVVALFMGNLLNSEPLSVEAFAGVALILVGVALLGRDNNE